MTSVAGEDFETLIKKRGAVKQRQTLFETYSSISSFMPFMSFIIHLVHSANQSCHELVLSYDISQFAHFSTYSNRVKRSDRRL